MKKILSKKYNIKKRYKALSLLEVLITLFVISVSMIAALNVVIKASTLIKDNEIQDTVNDIVLQTYELIRSSDSLAVSGIGAIDDLTVVNRTTSFSVRYTELPIRGYLEKSTSAFTSCDSSSSYLVQLPPSSNLEISYPVCLKVDIEKTSSGLYNIQISVRYSLSDKPNQLDVYVLNRYGEFLEI